MYDAKIGRWIGQDRIGFVAGDANLYRYVHNDPTNATDPWGLDTISTEFYWYYWRSFWFDNYVLAHYVVEGTFACKDGNVNVEITPRPTTLDKNYETNGGVGQPTLTQVTCKNGKRGYTVQIQSTSNLTAKGFWTTTSEFAAVTGVASAGTVAVVTWWTGPLEFITVPTAGVVGGLVGGLVGAGKSLLYDFSDWNSPVTVNYTVCCCCKDGPSVYTKNETVSISDPGNSSVGVGVIQDALWCDKAARWTWARNMETKNVGASNRDFKISTKYPEAGPDKGPPVSKTWLEDLAKAFKPLFGKK
jgi:hypothetical protein